LRSRLRLEGGTFETGLHTQLSTLQRVIDNGPMTGAALVAAEYIRPQSTARKPERLRYKGILAVAN
jgi:hypothetical protein